MVTADSLNLDVLEYIFGLVQQRDLYAIALVSQSFSAAVVSRMYKSIPYRLRHSKAYISGEQMSPFAVLISHPRLGIYVRHIDIGSVPYTVRSLPNSKFMQECRDAIQLCNNLTSFRFTAAWSNLVSVLIPSLLNKTSLRDLRLHCNVSTPAAKMLQKLKNLTNVSLQFASWNVGQVLVPWMSSVSTTLNSLTLYMTNDLHENVLKETLRSLPNLRSLHVVGCSRLDHSVVLGQVIHTPHLESLSMTTAPSDSPIPDFIFSSVPPLRNLKHLALDTKCIIQPHQPPSTTLETVLKLIKPSEPPLISFTLKSSERKFVLSDNLLTQLIENYGFSLRRLTFIDCAVPRESVEKICKSCINLEELALSVPTKDLFPFAQALRQSKSLHTLIDLEHHVEHGLRRPLDVESVRYLMSLTKSLRKVVTTTSTFVGEMKENFVHFIMEEPYQDVKPLWFIPSEPPN